MIVAAMLLFPIVCATANETENTSPAATTLPFVAANTSPLVNTSAFTTIPSAISPILVLGGTEIDGLSVLIQGSIEPGTNGSQITGIFWDWGDGRTDMQVFPAGHRYVSPGNYTVHVMVYQSDALSTSDSIGLTVRTAPVPANLTGTPEITNGTTLPATTASPAVPDIRTGTPQIDGFGILLNGSVVPGTEGTAITSLWVDWGDGENDSYPGFPLSHNYRSAGIFVVRIIVNQSDGASATKSIPIDLHNPLPAPLPSGNAGQPGSPPPWEFAALAIAIIAGAGGLFVGLRHRRTTPREKVLARTIEQYQSAKTTGDYAAAKEHALANAKILRECADSPGKTTHFP